MSSWEKIIREEIRIICTSPDHMNSYEDDLFSLVQRKIKEFAIELFGSTTSRFFNDILQEALNKRGIKE